MAMQHCRACGRHLPRWHASLSTQTSTSAQEFEDMPGTVMEGSNKDPYPSIPFRIALPPADADPEPDDEKPQKPVETITKCKVSVVVRIRPLQEHSGKAGKRSHQLKNPELWDDNVVTVSRPGLEGSEKIRCFTAVLGPQRSQQDVFDCAGKQLLGAFLDGEDCALLAYGQTGSGKSYTMFGHGGNGERRSLSGSSRRQSIDASALESGETEGSFHESLGLLPRFLLLLLNALPEGARLQASAVEVYCETVRDLLNDREPVKIQSSASAAAAAATSAGSKASNKKKARSKGCSKGEGKMQQSPPQGLRRTNISKSNRRKKPDVSSAHPGNQKIFEMVGQRSMALQNVANVMELVASVQSGRQEASHGLNEQSSRSHCVVQVMMCSDAKEGQDQVLLQPVTMTFVDLAGSERLKKSHSEGQRMREAVEVNKSLTTLGRCVRGLAEASCATNQSSEGTFLPIRDSALTMLLCKVLQGGRCCMAVTVAQDEEHGDESVASLEFGKSAALVQTEVLTIKAS